MCSKRFGKRRSSLTSPSICSVLSLQEVFALGSILAIAFLSTLRRYENILTRRAAMCRRNEYEKIFGI